MNKIPSFNINHLKLLSGVYISRIDFVGEEVLTTFDLRMKRPNLEPVINMAEIHTIEHIGATFLRNHPTYKDKTIYFGPMGCRTGFYLILSGEYSSKNILPLIIELFNFIKDFNEDIPGATARDCGNYRDMNLPMAKYESSQYVEILKNITESRLIYPE